MPVVCGSEQVEHICIIQVRLLLVRKQQGETTLTCCPWRSPAFFQEKKPYFACFSTADDSVTAVHANLMCPDQIVCVSQGSSIKRLCMLYYLITENQMHKRIRKSALVDWLG